MAGKGMKWEHVLLVVLIGVLVYLWISWPKPKPDERIKMYEQVIQDQQIIIDSLKVELSGNSRRLDSLMDKAQQSARQFEKTIANQRQQIKDNETIHELPTPELDSIVRELYGEGAI